MTESKEVEEILHKAYSLGIQEKVRDKALDWMDRKNMPPGIAYSKAFNKYTK
jgi:hypothetical protein